jgi:hypothetical protein
MLAAREDTVGRVSSEPAEHTRFRDYARALAQVSEADECTLIAEVLRDPDHTMADAAIIGHLDRRAATLSDNTAFTDWFRQLIGVLHGRVLPERRLREWSLLKDIDSGRHWKIVDLIEASDWLQRRIAEHTGSPQALTVLADQGGTKRVRNMAHARLGQRPA